MHIVSRSLLLFVRRVYSSEHPTKSDIRNGFWFHIDAAFGGVQSTPVS